MKERKMYLNYLGWRPCVEISETQADAAGDEFKLREPNRESSPTPFSLVT